MASAAPTAALDLLDPADFPDRDSLIGFLVNQCGWSTSKAGAIFGRSNRQIRRIASQSRQAGPQSAPATLTPAEAESMLRDYRLDPFTSFEERELAREWIVSVTAAGGAVVAN